jgi:glycosyltransferase involved in cell wall biosynthesis
VGDFAEFKNAPYHIYQDLDVETLIQWRRSGRSTHSFDQFSLDLLQRRKEIQLDIYRSAESILVASEWVAQQVRSYINEPEKVHAVGLGHRYSISKISETVVQQRYDNPCILFVGKDGTRKGLDILIRAYQNARKSLSHSKLTIVTDIDKLSEADKDICKKSEYINLFENVSLDQLQELYRTHSVFVMPSRFEAWGKVFFEAMSFGLPVIGANRCAMPEFIRDGVNGYTVQPDIVELCDALQRVFNSYNSYKKLSSNALSVADQYTWPTIINKIIKQIKI